MSEYSTANLKLKSNIKISQICFEAFVSGFTPDTGYIPSEVSRLS
jgi:hypothetical protein